MSLMTSEETVTKSRPTKPKLYDNVRILNTTWTGTVVKNERGYKDPYMVELDEATMKRLCAKDRKKYSKHYAGPFRADQLKILSYDDLEHLGYWPCVYKEKHI